MSSSAIAIALGVISLVGGALTAFISLRGQLAQVQVTREAAERQDVWRLIDQKDKDLAQLRSDMAELKTEYVKQAARLDQLDEQRIKDQMMIQNLQNQVRALGGTP